jgi:hypothetical protein
MNSSTWFANNLQISPCPDARMTASGTDLVAHERAQPCTIAVERLFNGSGTRLCADIAGVRSLVAVAHLEKMLARRSKLISRHIPADVGSARATPVCAVCDGVGQATQACREPLPHSERRSWSLCSMIVPSLPHLEYNALTT